MDNLVLINSKDDFVIKNKIEELLKPFDASIFDVEVVDLDECNVSELVASLSSVTLFDDQRFFWIKNPSSLTKKGSLDANSLDLLIKYIKNPMDSTIVFFSSNAYSSDGELSRVLKNYAIIYNLDANLDPQSYLDKLLLENNATMTKDAKAELLQRALDYSSLNNEVIKLSLYSEGKTIDTEMLDLVVSKSIDKKIYELTNALFTKNNTVIMNIYYDLLSINEDPIRIMGNMIGKLNEILYTKKLLELRKTKEEIAEYFNVSSGRAYYMIKQANEISYNALVRYLEGLKDLDIMIKKGNIDKTIGLELFLLKV